MDENTESSTVVQNSDTTRGEVPTKRMLLSEVYVHKMRKIDSDTNSEDQFDVFHIFEFADDSNTKVTPKLSTNCTEPKKIIEVLQNSTGSDTPQLERLIEKLCAQNKKSSDNNQRIRPNRTTATTDTPQTPPSIEDHNINATAITVKVEAPEETEVSAMTATPVLTMQPANKPTVPTQSRSEPVSTNVARITRIPNTAYQTNHPNGIRIQPNQSNSPLIRVKPTGSLTNAFDHTYQITASKTQQPVNRTITTASKPNAQDPKANTLKTFSSSENRTVDQPPAKQPVKLWNNMISKELPPLRITLSNISADRSSNKIIRIGTKLPTNDEENTNKKQTEHRRIENAIQNQSTLKIDGVFGGVGDDFGELFLNQSSESRDQATNNSSSPLLDSLVKEIDESSNDINTISLVNGTDELCADFRCNICLEFNDNFEIFEKHMKSIHGFHVVCRTCQNGFTNNERYQSHLLRVQNLRKCTLSPNFNRPFICIVDPPIILMRNKKVFAFRCKICPNMAFRNQKHYVQHAQKHAKTFRCKVCATKPLPSIVMRNHLNQHHPSHHIIKV